MDAGRLNQYVEIEQPTVTKSYGEAQTTWSTLAYVWAEILAAGSREVYRQAQVVGEVSFVVRIRYRSDVTARMRIVWGSRTLQILGTPFEESIDGAQILNMACREVDNA